MNPGTKDLLAHLAGRPGHDEVKAGFRDLLVSEFGAAVGDLDFEKRVPEVRGRIDALIGRTVFEAKSDLSREWRDVERRMPDYLADREAAEGERFVGIASDGLDWAAFDLNAGGIRRITAIRLDPEAGETFLAWLDGVVALRASIRPDPVSVQLELGRESVAFRRAFDELSRVWAGLADDPATLLKRQLWSQLLGLIYGREVENNDLWLQHTYLVVVAKAIALAVLDLPENDPRRILSGAAFSDANILGAVESDFFDWIVADDAGLALVRRLVAHVRRFRLREVECDVLKVLYESLIDRDERHGLGEYYTPDWLAAKIVRQVVAEPIEQRVLDPACGSGTFLFHAVRNFLEEAEDAGMEPGMRAGEVTAHVAGMDIHPVAVIIARVTYLLALAPAMATREGPIWVPVYLGDAMQLSVRQLMDRRELLVTAPPAPPDFGPVMMSFPELFCRDARLFDKLVAAIDDGAGRGDPRGKVEFAMTRVIEIHHKRDLTVKEEQGVVDLGATYLTYEDLHRRGRDSVWSYVARNLSRPLALSASGGWASVMVGNPPWVAFRHMSRELQARFRELAKGAKVHVGGKLATQNDLCALFVVRCAQSYLRPNGRVAMVLPMAALSRGQFEPFRSGKYAGTYIDWSAAWMLDSDCAPLFPVPACVVFGRRRNVGRRIPDKVTKFAGWLPRRDASEPEADKALTVTEGAPLPVEATFTGGSAYRSAFRQGATLVPRMLCLVERVDMGRLGGDRAMPLVESRRSVQEKEPWKSLPGVRNKVEARFLRPVLLGESILPFRLFRAFEGVVPLDEDGRALDAAAARARGHEGLAGWMEKAEAVWDRSKKSDISFLEQLDFYGKLSSQTEPAPFRVLYAASGTQPAAMVLRAPGAVIEHGLYWHGTADEAEAYYLAAVFGSETARARTAGRQARGQFGARHFDKVVFSLPIPPFSAAAPLHLALAEAGARAEALAAAVELEEGLAFQRARRKVREALAEAGVAAEIDGLVARLLDG